MNKDILSKLNKIAKQQNVRVELTDANKTKTLKELGLDSLSTIGIIIGVEQEYGVRIPDNVLGEIKTLEELVNTFDKLIKK